MSEPRTGGRRRLLTGVAWAALLLALCLCGSGTAGELSKAPGGVAAKGRSPAHGLPPAHDPLPGAGPQTDPKALAIKAIGLKAPIEGHGLDPLGGVEPPPYERANSVAWYKDGPQPGSAGAAVLVGHVDTDRALAVFAGLSVVKVGQHISVARQDGSVAEFVIEDIAVVANDQFDAEKVYGAREPDRAELRLITCGGSYDKARRAYSANVVVSAYLTGATPAKQPPSPVAGEEDDDEDEADAEDDSGQA
ncbi:class F sortase [Streptomyces albireticuli]|uniref:class F sortase n=1 Tax=Streptomyces albireticuli TaxID=1940 RepID=UPI0036C90A5F